MDTNSHTLCRVRQAEYQIRLRETQRRREAEQALGLRPTRRCTLPIRAWMSVALIAAGERMQRKFTTEPTHAESIRRMTPYR